jgi:hypothetical protein
MPTMRKSASQAYPAAFSTSTRLKSRSPRSVTNFVSHTWGAVQFCHLCLGPLTHSTLLRQSTIAYDFVLLAVAVGALARIALPIRGREVSERRPSRSKSVSTTSASSELARDSTPRSAPKGDPVRPSLKRLNGLYKSARPGASLGRRKRVNVPSRKTVKVWIAWP